MYFYLSSLQSLTNHPDNGPLDFTVDIVRPVILDNPSDWEIGLVEIESPFLTEQGNTDPTNYYVLTNCVDISIVGGFVYPVLRRLPAPHTTTAVTTSLLGTLFKQPSGTIDSTIDLLSTNQSTSVLSATRFDTPIYLPVTKSNLNSIRIYIRGLDLGDLETTAVPTYVTLHLRKKTIKGREDLWGYR